VTRPNGGEKQEIGRREQVRPPIHSYLKRGQRQQTQLTVIATHAVGHDRTLDGRGV
jgi:hypothetical protein